MNDLQLSIKFYRLFGFEISWEGNQPTGESWVHIRKGDFYLSLSQRRTPSNKRKATQEYGEMYGFQHMGWVVDCIDFYRSTLEKNNILKTDIETNEGYHTYFYDPDNNEIELIEYK